MAFEVESPAFRDGGPIPEKYARHSENISPPLAWKGAPSGTRSFLLVVEDPDAPSGVFRHWGLYDIVADRRQLPEGASADQAAMRPRHGINDFGNAGYDGPQPPRGHGVHHYHFRLAALDAETLPCGKKAKISEILKQAKPHVIAEAELVGTYETR